MSGIWITRNKRFMYDEVFAGRAKGIFLSESFDDSSKVDGVQPATILFPDTSCLRYYFDGRYKEFEDCYRMQLNEKFRDDFLALIAFSIYRGNDLIVFKDESDIKYLDILLEVLEDNFGIHAGDMDYNIEYDCDDRYDNSNLCVFYLKGYIKAKEFITSVEVDNGYEVSMDVVNKMLAEDVVEFPQDFDMTERNCYDYINDLLRQETAMRHGYRPREQQYTKPAPREDTSIDIKMPKVINLKPVKEVKKPKEAVEEAEVKQAMKTLFSVVKKEAPAKPKRKAGRPRKADKK